MLYPKTHYSVIMKTKFNKAIRVILGLGLLIFGLDKFFELIPHKQMMNEELVAAYTGLIANKFILPTVGLVQAISGLLLLTRKYSLFALLMMLPVTYGTIGFNLAVNQEGIIPALIVAGMHLYLLSLRKTTLINLVSLIRMEAKF